MESYSLRYSLVDAFYIYGWLNKEGDNTWPLHVNLAGFGFANYVNCVNEAMLSRFFGTPSYIAQKILRDHPHGRPVDIWGSSVVLYILLSRKFPVGGKRVGIFSTHVRQGDVFPTAIMVERLVRRQRLVARMVKQVSLSTSNSRRMYCTSMVL